MCITDNRQVPTWTQVTTSLKPPIFAATLHHVLNIHVYVTMLPVKDVCLHCSHRRQRRRGFGNIW